MRKSEEEWKERRRERERKRGSGRDGVIDPCVRVSRIGWRFKRFLSVNFVSFYIISFYGNIMFDTWHFRTKARDQERERERERKLN